MTAMTTPRDGDASGILNIDKPKGPTSYDVVSRVRRALRQRRVGHAGTLDPLATGVLVVCLGQAVRLMEYVADSFKSYRATIRFGLITDTWDMEGEVIERRPYDGLSLEAIQQVLPAFTGRIEQVPPMYSALKRDGRPLYRLARRGITVERSPRSVEVYEIKVIEWLPPDLVLQIACSKGTYIRSLAHDLGQALGTGAILAELARLAVGGFRLEEAISLEALLSEGASDAWKRHLLPMRAALGHMPGVRVDGETARRISFGQPVPLEQGEGPELCYAYDDGEQLLAILKRDRESGLWRPQKVLVG